MYYKKIFFLLLVGIIIMPVLVYSVHAITEPPSSALGKVTDSNAGISDNIKIEMSNNYPLKIDYIIPDKLQLYFIIAPRVEKDD